MTESGSRWAMAGDDDPLTATVRGNWRYHLARPGLEARRACRVAVPGNGRRVPGRPAAAGQGRRRARSPSAAGRSGSHAGACDAPGIGAAGGSCSNATSASACATACTCPPTSTAPTARAGSARSSSTSPTARTTCARCRTAARTSCWSRPGSCACGWTCAARAAPRVWRWTSTPRPSSSTASRWSTGSRARSGATATWARGASPTAASRASSSPPAGRPRCARSRRCTRPTTATATTCTTTAARWRAFELSNYPIRMIGMNALPPGEGEGPEFDRRWRERIDSTPAWVVRWLTEQRDGPYWRNGSLRPDYERIECPVFIVSGWHDGYRTAGLRMARRLRSPWQLLAGPWTHVAPDRGVPRPVYPFMRELIAVLPHPPRPRCGRGRCSRPPRSVVFIEEHDSPAAAPERVSGEWISSDVVAGRRAADDGADAGGAADRPAPRRRSAWPPATGARRRPTAACSATSASTRPAAPASSSEPLTEPVAVLGAPRVRFRIAHPGPRAIVSVKLNDVAPGGESQPVTRGAVNLACDGEAAVELDLMATGLEVSAGAPDPGRGRGQRLAVPVAAAPARADRASPPRSSWRCPACPPTPGRTPPRPTWCR